MPAATSAPTASSAVATALSLNVAAVIPVFLFGGLAVQISNEFGMSAAAIGLVSSIYFACSGLTAVPAGRLVERFGSLACARFAIANSAAVMVAIAAFAQNTVGLVVLLALAAPANSLGQLASNSVLSHWAPGNRKGLMFGMKQSSVPLSTLLAGLAVPAIALTLGWRWAFVAGALVALLAFGPLTGLGRPEIPVRTGNGKPLDRRLLLFGVATFASAAAATPVGSFLTTYAVHLGSSEAYAGLMLTIGGLCGVGARTAAGALGDWHKGGEFAIIVAMLIGGAIGSATYMIGSVALLPIAVVCSFALGWAWPGLMNFAITRRYPDAPAAATSITQTGIFLGGAAGPLAFGLAVDQWGWNVGWTAMLVAMVLAAAFIAAGARVSARAPA